MPIKVHPDLALFDQEIEISLDALVPSQHVTLRCFTYERKTLFQSHAHFVADLSGSVNLRTDASFGGSFVGIAPMGMFWSMQPVDDKGKFKPARYIRKNVMEPAQFVLQLFEGHLDGKTLQMKPQTICEKVVYRSCMTPGVTRHTVEHGRLRGYIFKPPGEGPFKGVIDIYGGNGGIVEVRAALLASHGFACYTLPFCRYKDLPKEAPLELKYLLEACIYLQGLDYIQPGISVVGLSFGASVMLRISTWHKSCIKNVVAIGAVHYFRPEYFKDAELPSADHHYLTGNREMVPDEYGAYDIDHSIYDAEITEPVTTPLELSPKDTKYLFIIGEDDQNVQAMKSYQILRNRMVKHGREGQLQCLHYPKAGHFIDPPYMPQTLYGLYFAIFGIVARCGGDMVQNAAACLHSWREILKFLEQNTGTSSKL